MSDAPQQPQLRLKPRLKNEPEAAQPIAPPPVPPPVQSAEEKQAAAAPIAFKLRSATPPPTADLPPSSSAPAPTPPPPVVAAPAAPTPAPAGAAAPAEPASDAPSRLRLRSKENDPSAAAAADASPAGAPEEAAAASAEPTAPKGLKLTAKVPQTLHPHPEGVPPAFLAEVPAAPEPPPAPAAPTPGMAVDSTPAPAPGPAPFPEPVPASDPVSPAPATPVAKRPPPSVKPTLPPPPTAPKPKVPHFKPTERLNMPAPAIPEAAPAGVKALKVSVGLVAVLIVLLLSAGGYFVWQYLNTPEPPPPAPKQVTHAPAPKPAEGAEPAAPAAQPTGEAAQAKPDDSIAHLPAKLINKAQDSLAARRSIEQERTDSILDGRDLPADRGFPLHSTPLPPATPPREPGAPASQQASGTGYSNIAPGVVATDSSIRTTGKPSIAFRRIVSDFVIRGVYQGTPSRAHINGRIVTAGNMVDKELQVTFIGVDAEEKMLIFRDAAGATVMRRY